MPAYAYPIKINYNKEKIAEYHRVKLPDGGITVSLLKEIVGDNTFVISNEEEHFWENQFICWTTYREETDEEQEVRIAKEEAYMVEYNKRKAIR